MSAKLRLHIESLRSKPPHMHITEEVYAAAAARHPHLSQHLEVTVSRDGERFAQSIASADILFGQGFPTAELKHQAAKLRWVSVVSAGVENLLPLDWLPDEVVLTNNSGAHRPRAREYAALMLLALNQRLPKTLSDQRAHRWAPAYSPLISGKHVVVIGFGNIGQAVAEAAALLGLRVTAVRRQPGASAPGAEQVAAQVAGQVVGVERLPSVLPDADFVVIATPLTAETRGLIGPAALAAMKPGVGLINMGRGPVVDTQALCQNLETGHVSGAVLDVFDAEPLPTDATLWDVPNVIITPHNSSDDPEQYIPRSFDLFFENLERFLAGEPLANVIDPARGY